MERVILLNADYTFLNIINWKRAVVLLVKEKVEVLKDTGRSVTNFEKTKEFVVPKVLRLVKLVKSVYRNRVPFSRKNVMIRDNYTCQYCGTKENLTIDHVIPKAQGGISDFENCTASCKPCNNYKNDRTPKQAKMRLRKRPHHPTIIEFFRIRMKSLGVYETLEEMGIYF